MASKNKGMRMQVTLPSYLRQLRAEESRKPEEERFDVPTMRALAEVAGISQSSLSSIVTRRTRSLNLDVAASIIGEMRRRGFNTQITDILKFEMPGESNSSRSLPPPLTRRQRREFPGEEFVKAYQKDPEDETSSALIDPIQTEILPEVAEVVRMLTKFPDPIQRDAAEALKRQLELVQKTLSFQGESLPK